MDSVSSFYNFILITFVLFMLLTFALNMTVPSRFGKRRERRNSAEFEDMMDSYMQQSPKRIKE